MTTTTTATPTVAPPAKPTINIKLIVPFINSVRNVFSKMLNANATVQRPSVKVEPVPLYDVSGIIGFSGDILGSVVVSFPKATAVKAVAAFAGVEMDPTSADFADAIGELTNMVAGGAKKDLGLNAGIGCPSVIIGAGHTIARLRDVPCLVIPCESALGMFAIEVSIKQVSGAVPV
jgi:chemotaxis protein CheX